MCTVAMNEPLMIGNSVDYQLSSVPSSDDWLSEFDQEQTADLLAVSSLTAETYATHVLSAP